MCYVERTVIECWKLWIYLWLECFFRKLKLKLVSIFFSRRDIATIRIALGITKTEYTRRYNDKEYHGYKSKILEDSNKDLQRLKKDFDYMLGIE